MARFRFTALDSKGREVHGEVEADNQSAAGARIREKQYFPTKIEDLCAGDGRTTMDPGNSRKWVWITALILLAVCIVCCSLLGSLDNENAFSRFVKSSGQGEKIEMFLFFGTMGPILLLPGGAIEFAPEFMIALVGLVVIVSMIFFGLVGLLIIPMAIFGFIGGAKGR